LTARTFEGIALDVCAEGCGGVWFDDVFGDQLAEMRAESEAKRDKAARFAHMFRFITPSYYIPGKQDWGAY
jgi:Zn-finger nucleic acid-binding protein